MLRLVRGALIAATRGITHPDEPPGLAGRWGNWEERATYADLGEQV